MKNPLEAIRDPARLAALRGTDLLDTPYEEAFDQMVRLASRLLRSPTALVSLVDEDRQFFKACLGVPEPWGSARETPLSYSFCQYVVAEREPLIVGDAREHPVLKDSPAIRDLGVIAYLGVPLSTPDGSAIGSLCVTDSRPRQWSEEDLETLRSLAASVMSTIQLRSAARAAERKGGAEAPSAAAGAPAGGSSSLRQAYRAAEGLRDATLGFLQRLDEYEQLLCNYEPTAESLAEENRLRAEIQAAEQSLREAASEFARGSATVRKYRDDPLLRNAVSLFDTIGAYFEAEQRRSEASRHFQQLAGPLTTLERALAVARRAESRVREAANELERAAAGRE